jgi:hypothetical protein
MTATRMAVVGFFVALGGLLVRSGLPRTRRIRLLPTERVVTPNDARSGVSWGEDAELRLVAVPPGPSSGRARYGVCLDGVGGAPLLLLSSNDPADVLGDLRALRTSVSLPVIGGWGLPPGNPWADRPAPASVKRSVLEDSDEDPDSRRRIATTLLVGAGGVAALLAAEASRRVMHDETATVLSLALPFLPVILLLVVGNALATAESRLSLNPDLLEERRVFGVALRRRVIPRGNIRSACLVSPHGAAPRHLLVETDDHPVALPYEGSGADIAELFRPTQGGADSISIVPPRHSRS